MAATVDLSCLYKPLGMHQVCMVSENLHVLRLCLLLATHSTKQLLIGRLLVLCTLSPSHWWVISLLRLTGTVDRVTTAIRMLNYFWLLVLQNVHQIVLSICTLFLKCWSAWIRLMLLSLLLIVYHHVRPIIYIILRTLHIKISLVWSWLVHLMVIFILLIISCTWISQLWIMQFGSFHGSLGHFDTLLFL